MTTSMPDQPQAPAESTSASHIPAQRSGTSLLASGAPAAKPDRVDSDDRLGRIERKRERIRAELDRNQVGGHRIPTWVMACALGLIVVVWILLLVTS